MSDQNRLNEHMNTLICVAEKFIVGGVETYYMRMFSWAHCRGYRTILLLPQNAFIADEWKAKIEKEMVEVWFYSSSLFSVKVSDSQMNRVSFDPEDLSQKTVVCDNLHTYTAACYIAQKYEWNNARLLLYILHPEMSRCSETKLFNLGYRHLLVKKIMGNGLLFMDEQTLCSFENYYGYKVNAETAILRLGQDIPGTFEFRERDRDSFHILSVSRMDFPFKGYVLGLIDSCRELKERYPGLKLTLIGDGPGYDRVLSKVKELELEQDINLLKTVPYEELEQYITGSDLCVGMGTSLLDAGKRGKIGIIATANQYMPFSCGFLFDNPDQVAVFAGEKGWNRYRFAELVAKVMDCGDDVFRDWCRKSYEVVKEKYDICNIMEKLVEIETHKLPRGTVCRIKVYDWIILKLKRLAGVG